MSVMFFGQYLLQERKINVEQLRQALDLVEKTKISFSQLAVERGELNPVDASRLDSEEVDSNRLVEKLVVDYGLLSEEQVIEVKDELAKRQLRLGEALIKLGHLPADQLSPLLETYHQQQAPFQIEPIPLPGSLGGNRLAAYVVDFLPKMLESLSELKLKIGSSWTYTGENLYENLACLSTLGSDAICVTLSADDEFTMALMEDVVGLRVDEPNRAILEDVLGEFLNIVIGNAVVAFEQDGGNSDLEFPAYGELPQSGYVFELACTTGQVRIVIEEL